MSGKTHQTIYRLLAGICLLLALNTVGVLAQETTEEPPSEPVSEVTEEATEVPTATPEPTSEPTTEPTTEPTEAVTETPDDPTSEPTETPTDEAPVIAPEPPLSLLLSADFSSEADAWLVSPGWNLSGNSAAAAGLVEPLVWLTPAIYNLAVDALVQGEGGSAVVQARVNGPLAYGAGLNASGEVTLYRAGQPVMSALVMPSQPDQWRLLRLSAIEDVVRVSLDAVEIIAWVDDAPLPPGQVALALNPAADEAVPAWAFTGVNLWVPSSELGLYPPPEPVEATEEVEVEITEEPVAEVQAAQARVSDLEPPTPRLPAEASLLNTLRPRLVWTAVRGARGYRVDLAASSDFASPILEDYFVRGTALTLSRTVLPEELRQGTYFWRVQVVDVEGEWSVESATASFSVGLPRTPRMDTFSTNNRIPLVWTRALDASRYRLLVGDATFSNLLVDLTTDNNRITRYVPTREEPWPLGLWFWRVDVEINGEWVVSPIVYRFTVTPRPLPPPLPLTPDNRLFTNNQRPTFSWAVVADPDSQPVTYWLQVSTFANFRDNVIDTVLSDTSFTPDFDMAEARYYWRVSTLNYLNAPGRWSRRFFFTVDITPPLPPVLAAPRDASTTTATTVTFRWRASRGAATYEFRLLTVNPDEEPVPPGTPIIDTARRVSYRVTEPLLIRTYYWQARATDAAGNTSDWSAPFSLVVQSPANAVPVLNRYPVNSPTLTWTPISWAQGYQLQVAINRNFSHVVYNADSIADSSLSHTLAQPLPPGVYYWRIRARSSPTAWGNWSTTGTFLIQPPE